MKKKSRKFKRNSNPLNKLSLFQKNDARGAKKCPLSGKDAPIIDYKNIKLLRKYLTENSKILSSRITAVSQNKQRKINREVRRAKFLGLL
tara:strand:+ start:331 stop:600 length:270 start_codon:yes stop_codon:yes gene_type:complete